MEPLLCFPTVPPATVTGVLDRSGYPWRGIEKPEAAEIEEPEDGWSGAVVCSGDDPVGAFLLCRHLRKRELRGGPQPPISILEAPGGSAAPGEEKAPRAEVPFPKPSEPSPITR